MLRPAGWLAVQERGWELPARGGRRNRGKALEAGTSLFCSVERTYLLVCEVRGNHGNNNGDNPSPFPGSPSAPPTPALSTTLLFYKVRMSHTLPEEETEAEAEEK